MVTVIRNSSLTLNKVTLRKAVYLNENFHICLFARQRFSPTVGDDLKHEGDLAFLVLANNGGSSADHYYIEVKCASRKERQT